MKTMNLKSLRRFYAPAMLVGFALFFSNVNDALAQRGQQGGQGQGQAAAARLIGQATQAVKRPQHRRAAGALRINHQAAAVPADRDENRVALRRMAIKENSRNRRSALWLPKM